MPQAAANNRPLCGRPAFAPLSLLYCLFHPMLFSRRNFLLGTVAAPLIAAKKKAAPDKKKGALEKPNIILIVVDELPAWMLGAYGNKEVRSPNLDRLTQTGTHFLNHFTSAPEARLGAATLYTGRTPMQIGPEGAIAPADVTLDKLLAGAGYTCHAPGSLSAAEITTSATKFLGQQSAGKPFFLNLRYSELRPPYDSIPQKYVDLYASQPFADYSREAPAPNARAGRELMADRVPVLRKVAGAITYLDDSIEAVLTQIYNKQLIDQTLIVFTSTCGSLYGRHGLWDSGDASEPPNMYDEVVKTPMVWSWPGRVPALATQVELVSAYDLVPSLCDLLDIEVPERNLCGRSYKLLATGKRLPKKQTWRTTVFAQYKDTGMARVERYKVVLRNGGKGPNELYDLASDASETNNQADNDQFVSVKNTLSGELAQWKQKYSA